MAFPTLGAQQETSRKILEEKQIKKQHLQKGVPAVGGTTAGSTSGINNAFGQAPTQSPEFAQSQRTAFNINSTTALGYFITQDSYYGNNYIPVLPRLDPPTNHTPK